ncbi:MAG: stage III sporulation protein AE [Dorea sp.]
MRKVRKKTGHRNVCILCLLGISVMLTCILTGAECRASEKTDRTEQEMEELSDIEEELLDLFEFGEVDEALKELFPEERVDFKETLMGVLSGDLTFSAELLNQLVLDQLDYAFRISRKNLIHILAIAAIAAVLHNFSGIFQNRQIAGISFYVVYMLLIAILLNSFKAVSEWVQTGVEDITAFMTVFCPLYFLAVSIAKGSVTSAAFYHLVLVLISLAEYVILKIVIPVIHIYMMLKILNYLSEEDYLSKGAELIGMVVNWGLKTLLACVIGLNVIQGMISPAIDTVKRSILTRGAEAIPGVGDAIGGMTEVVLGTAVLIKNGIGMTGAIICIALCVVPLVQIGCITLLYHLAAAVIQPVSDKRIVGCVETAGEGCRMLMRVVFTTGMLFLLTIAIVTAVTGNI